MTTTQNSRRIMRLADVEQATGFKRSHIYNLMSEGRFPKARRIGCRAVGWDSTEIQQWIENAEGSPLPPLQGQFDTPTIQLDGVLLEGVSIEITPDAAQ